MRLYPLPKSLLKPRSILPIVVGLLAALSVSSFIQFAAQFFVVRRISAKDSAPQAAWLRPSSIA